MRLIIITVCITLATGLASATIDPDQDSIGIYFDPGATSNCLTIGAGVAFPAYVVITNPSAEYIDAVSFSSRIVTVPDGQEANLFQLGAILPLGAIRVGEGPATDGDYGIGFAEPAHVVDNTVAVIEWQFMMLVVMGLEFYLSPNDGDIYFPAELPYYTSNDGTVPLGVSSGHPNLQRASAVVNGDCPVAQSDMSFGAVNPDYS